MNKRASAENLQDAAPDGEVASKPREPKLAKRTCIMVLGMHRSGTSALTRAISLLGAELPRNILGAYPTNETGHWEPARLVELHDQMLAEASSRWDDWRAFDPTTLGEPRLARYRDDIKALILEEFGDAPLFVLKDPRICRFVPFYESLLADMGVVPLFVLPNRHPLAVFASLKERDGITADFACFVWLRHVLDAEAATRGKRRSFISYEEFLRDWRDTIGRVGEALDLSWPTAIAAAEADIEAYLRPELQHHTSSWGELQAGAVNVWVRDAYAALCALGKQRPESHLAQDELSRIRREFDKASAVFGKATFPELARREQQASLLADHAKHAEAETAALKERQAVVANELSVARETIASMNRESKAARERMAHLEKALAEQRKALAELRNEFDAQLAAAREMIDARDAEIALLLADRDNTRAEIDAIYASASWRAAAPLRAAKQLWAALGKKGRN
ncbi:hypothetical protein [Mesorhizobium sp. 43Arga]